jgi:hypothetical protein
MFNNRLNRILDARSTLVATIDSIIDDPMESVTNKVAAVIFGETSSNRKRALVEKILKSAGLVEPEACVHVKNGSFLASQITITRDNDPHYIAAITDKEDFCLVRFNPIEARQIGKPCHGTKVQSDAVRSNINEIGEYVFIGKIDYAE